MLHYVDQLVANFVCLLCGAEQVAHGCFLELCCRNSCHLQLETMLWERCEWTKTPRLWAGKPKQRTKRHCKAAESWVHHNKLPLSHKSNHVVNVLIIPTLKLGIVVRVENTTDCLLDDIHPTKQPHYDVLQQYKIMILPALLLNTSITYIIF